MNKVPNLTLSCIRCFAAGLIAGCVADAKAYYTLSFAAAAADHPNEYHNLQIKIDKPGLTARTRTGYYAQRQEVAK